VLIATGAWPKSLCGSESTVWFKTEFIEYEFKFDQEFLFTLRQEHPSRKRIREEYQTMSSHDHLQLSDYERRLVMQPRCELVVLQKDNNNQGIWMDSINRWIRSNEAWRFMLKQFNVHRKLDISKDFAVDGPLKDVLVKVEK
jgi:hypothetical protein